MTVQYNGILPARSKHVVVDKVMRSLTLVWDGTIPQDDQSRNAVVAMAARAQAWMQRQADALAAVLDQQVSRKRKSKGQQQQQQQQAGEQGPLPEVVFGPRGLTQLLMGLVRMGGRPSREWMGTWGSAAMMLAVPGAEQLGGVTRTAGGRVVGGCLLGARWGRGQGQYELEGNATADSGGPSTLKLEEIGMNMTRQLG